MINEHDIKDFPGSPYAEDFEKTQPVMEAVFGYDIRRSTVSNQLYNVFAVNFMNEVLYPMVVDVNFDTALNYKLAYDSALDNGVASVQQEKILTTGQH